MWVLLLLKLPPDLHQPCMVLFYSECVVLPLPSHQVQQSPKSSWKGSQIAYETDSLTGAESLHHRNIGGPDELQFLTQALLHDLPALQNDNFQERSEKLTRGSLFLINASDRWHTIRSHNSWDFPILRDMSTSRTQTSARFPPEELPPTINGNLKQNQGPNPPPPAKHSTQPALPAPWWQAASSFCNALQSGSGSLSSSSHFCMNEKGPSSSALLQLSAPTLWRQSFPSNRTVTLKITQTVLGDTW